MRKIIAIIYKSLLNLGRQFNQFKTEGWAMISQNGIKLLIVKLSPLAVGILCASFGTTILLGYQPGLLNPLTDQQTLIPSFIGPSFPTLMFIGLLLFSLWLISLWLVNLFLQKVGYAAKYLRRFFTAGLILMGLSYSLLYFPPQESISNNNLIFLAALTICLAWGLALFTNTYLNLFKDATNLEKLYPNIYFYWPALFSLGALLTFNFLSGAAWPQELNLQALKLPGLVLGLSSLLSLVPLILVYGIDPCPPQSESISTKGLKDAWKIKGYKKFLCLEVFITACWSTFLFAFPIFTSDFLLVDSLFAFALAKLILLLAFLSPAGLWYLTRFIKPATLLPVCVFLQALGLAALAFTNFWPNPAGIPFDKTTSVTVTSQHEIVFGSIRGALLWDGEHWQLIDQRDGLIANEVLCVLASDKGIWFGTKKGASFWDRQNWTHYSKASGLVDNEVFKIIVKGEAIWFGTPKGISLLQDAAFHQFVPPILKDKHTSVIVTSFALAEDGELWVGTSSGVCSYKDGRWAYYNSSNGLPDDNITALLTVASRGDESPPDEVLIIGSKRGTAHLSLKQKTWSYLNITNGLPANQVISIKALSGGELFIATTQGLFITDSYENSRRIDHQDGLVHDLVVDVAQAQDGSLWFATPYGVSSFKNGLWQTYQSLAPKIWGCAFAFLITIAIMGCLIFAIYLNSSLYTLSLNSPHPTISLGLSLWHLSAKLLGLAVGPCILLAFCHYLGQTQANPQGLRFAWLCSAFISLICSIVLIRQAQLKQSSLTIKDKESML